VLNPASSSIGSDTNPGIFVIAKVYPSGLARATYDTAIALDAPGLFCTTTVVPSSFSRYTASERAVISVPPPGANPTINSIGRSGQAQAGNVVHSAAIENNARAMVLHGRNMISLLGMNRNEGR